MAVYKRANINGTTPLDIKGINDNFMAIFLKLFGDISMSDIQDDIKSMLYTNWLQPQGEGNLDSSYPLVMRFYIPETTKEVKKAEFNFIASKYRMDSSIAKNNKEVINISGFTVKSLLETKTPEYGLYSNQTGHTYFYGIVNEAVYNEDEIYNKNVPTSYDIAGGTGHYHTVRGEIVDHSHDISHTHDISHGHTIESNATLPEHSHELEKGIVVDTEALPTMSIKLNGTNLGVTLNNTTLKADKVNVKDKLLIGDWNTLEVSCADHSDGRKGIARITVFGILELLQKY